MIGNTLMVLFFLLAPAAVIWLCRRVKWLDRIGPVLILYILGIIVGNLFHPAGMAQIQDLLSSAMVPLAIPLMLFGCTFSRSQTRSQLLALVTGLVAVVLAVVAGYFIFGRSIPDGAKIGGMLTGVYTGGTMNMAALKAMLGVSEETFILLNSYDMVISFLFLTMLLSFGIKLIRKILPNETAAASAADEAAIRAAVEQTGANPYKGLFTREGLKDAGFLLLIDIAIIAVSAGLGLLAGDGWFMTVLVLMLTTLGIAASFWKPVKSRKYGYEMGMYLIYVFSVVVASMADLSKFDIASGMGMLAFLTFTVFVSFLVQLLLARLLKVDADTMTISSVSYICSPPFVPMMAAAMKNRAVLASGLAIGVVGYAAGNYLGFAVAHLLELVSFP
ncbi:MAG: DUF819 family protein [Bacteroidales bacterium]|nr:DUF819 family protein [Bacteroidales bacterium]